MFVESVAHYLQAKCIAGFTLASHVPGFQVAFGDIDHVADYIAHFPFAAACLDVPVSRVVNDVVEIRALGTCYVEYGIFAAVIHWIDWHRSLLLLCDISRFNDSGLSGTPTFCYPSVRSSTSICAAPKASPIPARLRWLYAVWDTNQVVVHIIDIISYNNKVSRTFLGLTPITRRALAESGISGGQWGNTFTISLPMP